MKRIIKVPMVAIAISLLAFGAQAAGLGQFNVRSKLGEPLNVEIQINATQQELQSLTARIAPSDVFLQANIPYASFVPNVRVTVENKGDRSVLKLSTNTPVNEAVASLIVQLNWDDGRIARTYNILLDPPDLAIRPPAPVEPAIITQTLPPPLAAENPLGQLPAQTPPAQAQEAPTPKQELELGDDPVAINYRSRSESESPPVTVQEEVVASPPERPPVERPPVERAPVEERVIPPPPPSALELDPPGSLGGDDYTVKSGDTLGAIANRHMSGEVTLDQMMMALYRANQAAFVGNNINRLRSGAILKIPSADEIRSTSHTEARKEVRIHAREFNVWRAQLGADVASHRPKSSMEQGTGGLTSVERVPPPAERDSDQLQIANNTEQGGDVARMQRMQEDLVAKQRAMEEFEERIKELEEMNKLRELRDQKLAKSRQQIPPPVAPEPVPPPAAEITPPSVPEPPSAVDETLEVPSEPISAESAESVVAEAETAQEPPPGETSVAVPAEYDLPEEYKDPLMRQVENIWELATDPRILGVISLFIVVLGALFGIRSWRNKRSDVGLDTLSQDDTSMFLGETTSFFGDNGGQSVDTTASSVVHTDFSQTGLSIDTNEGVDPVAEADVYMAYGRDSQAEEILTDALKTDPKRGAIYVKLLEIYAQRQDLTQFETRASELFSRTAGQGRDWEKAAQMGRRLDPSNPLYAGGSSKQGKGEVSKMPELEPTLEEPSTLDAGMAMGSAGFGPVLSDLDFGTSSTVNTPATDAGHLNLKETVVIRDQLDDILSTQATVVPGARAQSGQERSSGIDAVGIDFQFEPLEKTPKTAGSIDFDLGKTKAKAKAKATSEAGKQPISVTITKPSANTASKKTGTAPILGKGANDLVKPLDFDSPARNMAETVVLPSAHDGKAHGDEVTLDLEKTGFDPSTLDFDLDLDLKPDVALPVSDPIDTLEAGEIDTKLELALAYKDMGDNEGALELLREVIIQGNAAQKAEAKALIANLS